MRYFDASAIAKLVLAEHESSALRTYLGPGAAVGLTSAIARTEVAIAIARRGGDLEKSIAETDGAMAIRGCTFRLVDVDMDVAKAAAAIGSVSGLRTLDALHVATAALFRPRLTEVVTYDKRMIAACTALDLPTASPGA